MQRTAAKIIPSLQRFTYEKRLKQIRKRRDLITMYGIMKNMEKLDRDYLVLQIILD